MIDKKFVKENNLSEAVERFRSIAGYHSPRQSLKQKINEYAFSGILGEDDEQQDGGNNGQQGGGAPPQGGAPDMGGGMPPMGGNNAPGGQDQMGGGMPPQGGPDDGGMGAPDMGGGDMGGDMPPAPQGGAPDGGAPEPPQDAPMDGEEGPEPPEDPMGDAPEGEEEDVETEEMEGDDEVIDVDDLTQSQEATEYKIDGVDDRLSSMVDLLKKFEKKLDVNQDSIEKLKSEFEKRNPTEEEKLNLRSQSSYPYSETPKEYWDKLTKDNPKYNVMYDNEVSPSDEQKKFEIKKGDISGLDMRSISDTLNIDQKLEDYLGI